MYTIAALSSLLLASTASAGPLRRWTSAGAEGVTIQLQNQAIELGSGTTFDDVTVRQILPPTGASGPFKTINILVDDSAPNQDIRCQALGADGQPLLATRGENLDTTFSDAGNGEWTFQGTNGVYVSNLICDPAFVADNQNDDDAGDAPLEGGDATVSVLLSNSAIELGSNTEFDDPTVREVKTPIGSSGPYRTVELFTGEAFENQALRCRIFDQNGRVIRVIRGENNDTTFTDGDGGEWTLERESEVSRIVCNPRFVANPAK